MAETVAWPESPSRPTPEEVIARARVHLALSVVLGIFAVFLGLGTLTIMIVPLAHVIAGTHTSFIFSLSLSISASLAVSTAIASGVAMIQTQRVRRYKERTLALEKRLGYTPDGEADEAEEGSH